MSSNHIYSYKYRIYPNKEQEECLGRIFGSVRFIWNQYVANFNSWSKDGPNQELTIKKIKGFDGNDWLSEVPYDALMCKRRDFEETQKQYFSKTRKSKSGRPQFKKRGVSNDSFRINGKELHGGGFDQTKSTLKIPKLTQPIKVVIDRNFTGKIKSVTISRNKTNQFFVSVLVEEVIEQKPKTGRSVGIDLGLNHLAVLSDGTKIDNPRWFRETQAELRKAQQHLSRKVRGSRGYEKQKLKVARIYRDITNRRMFFLHNLSKHLVNNYDHIIMESLSIKNMIKSRMAKSIMDASWGEFVRQVEYKSNWYGRTFHQISRWYPSSKTCSSCGHKMGSMELDIRTWTCPQCLAAHDRDINAATNILMEGFRDLYQLTSDELADYIRGAQVGQKIDLPAALKR